jgi:molybdenum cofactor guanylyltransferase
VVHDHDPAAGAAISSALAPAQITGVVLAGGRGARMGGVDKGLQLFHGRPLALQALLRLQPQVGACMINANRHLEQYRQFGVPVVPDTVPDYAGPLAGFASALAQCKSPWLVTVPCDSPLFPTDLVARLAEALVREQADIAMASAPENEPASNLPVWRAQPVFCLLPVRLRASLDAFIASGRRKIDAWTAQHRTVVVAFDDARAFANANTLDQLQDLQT